MYIFTHSFYYISRLFEIWKFTRFVFTLFWYLEMRAFCFHPFLEIWKTHAFSFHFRGKINAFTSNLKKVEHETRVFTHIQKSENEPRVFTHQINRELNTRAFSILEEKRKRKECIFKSIVEYPKLWWSLLILFFLFEKMVLAFFELEIGFKNNKNLVAVIIENSWTKKTRSN